MHWTGEFDIELLEINDETYMIPWNVIKKARYTVMIARTNSESIVRTTHKDGSAFFFIVVSIGLQTCNMRMVIRGSSCWSFMPKKCPHNSTILTAWSWHVGILLVNVCMKKLNQNASKLWIILRGVFLVHDCLVSCGIEAAASIWGARVSSEFATEEFLSARILDTWVALLLVLVLLVVVVVPTTGIPKTPIGAEVAESSMDMIQIWRYCTPRTCTAVAMFECGLLFISLLSSNFFCQSIMRRKLLHFKKDIDTTDWRSMHHLQFWPGGRPCHKWRNKIEFQIPRPGAAGGRVVAKIW